MAEALRQGFSPDTTLEAKSPLVVPMPGEDWTVQNYGGASYGHMDMRTATMKSVNTYYAQLMVLVGADKAAKLTDKMGIDGSAAYDSMANPAMVLGGVARGLTPVEMASAYGTFARNGVHVEAHLLAEVPREPQKTQVLDPSVNAVALDILKGPVSPGGTAPMSLPNFPIVGKTGTTQLATDAWFVGTTPVMSTAVWVGYPEGQIRMAGYTGGGMAAPVWLSYMSAALEGREPRDFPEVEDAEFVGKMIKVPDVTGLSEQQALSKLAKIKLVGRVQRQASPSPVGTVIWASPDDEAQMGTTVYLGVSTGEPPPPPEADEDEGDKKPDDSGGQDGESGNGNEGNEGEGNGDGGD
jgi:membrane peptidoglycan carboxypeptidase